MPNPGKLIRPRAGRVLSEERGGCSSCSPRPGCGYSGATRRGTSQEEEEEEEEKEEEKEEEEEEEEEGLFKADAVNEEDSERDRATQV